MNNYYTLVHLARELSAIASGAEILGITTPQKFLLECSLNAKTEPFRILFSTNPNLLSFFYDVYRPAKKMNTTDFFTEVYGKRIKGISVAKNDRFLELRLEDNYSIMIRMFGHRANALLIKNETVIDAFRNRGSEIGLPKPEPSPPNLFGHPPDNLPLNKFISSVNPLLSKSLITEIERFLISNNITPELYRKYIMEISEELPVNAVPVLLEDNSFCMLPPLLSGAPVARTFDDVNSGIRQVFKQRAGGVRVKKKKSSWQPQLIRFIERKTRSLKQLEKVDEQSGFPEKYEQWGHLLMAIAHQKIDADSVEVQNFFGDGEILTIPLNPNKTISENAEKYYEKAKQIIISKKQASERIPALQKEIKEAKEILKELEATALNRHVDEWEKKHEGWLKSHLQSQKGSASEEFPFRKADVQNFEIWIGRSATNNELLLQKSHKEDVWLHARGVPGSHVIIRMSNNRSMPEESVILEAAALAAWFSKAKGAGLVPVIVAKRKYIRKLKGGNPGQVFIDREEVRLVEPKKWNE